MIVDTEGITQGQVLYDSYGAVLTATLPVTLTAALAGQGATPDPDTGLVYLGDGHYYDPALGRPLQPNPVGGPPTVPQALNRYAATAWGAPGVVEGAANNVFNWTPHAVGFVKNLSVELVGQVPIVAGYRYTGLAVIEVTASRTALTRRFPAELGRSFTDPAFAFAEEGREFYARRGFSTLTADSLEGLRNSADDMIALLENTLPSRKPWTARIAMKGLDVISAQPIYGQLDDLLRIKSFRTGVNAGLDFVIGFGFQYLEDSRNPYLSRRQATSRALLSGSGGALFAMIGGMLLCPETAGIGCAVAVGTGGGIAWSLIQDPFFDLLEHSIFAPVGVHILPVRNLRPLEDE